MTPRRRRVLDALAEAAATIGAVEWATGGLASLLVIAGLGVVVFAALGASRLGLAWILGVLIGRLLTMALAGCIGLGPGFDRERERRRRRYRRHRGFGP